MTISLDYTWRADFENPELRSLHAEGFGEPADERDWRSQVDKHSLGWVCARQGGELLGFVNVAWDGGVHAFLLDTVVAVRARGLGVGTRLVATAADGARAAGCQWLHVDFEAHLRGFYLTSCGFSRTDAGLIAL